MASTSITKRGDVWQYRIKYFANGERKSVSQSGFKTKRDAKDAAIIKENELLSGQDIGKDKIPLADYMERWKTLYKDGTVSVGVSKRIDMIIRYVKENYNLPLKELTHENYQEYLNELAAKLSTESVKKYHTYTKAAIKQAVKARIIMVDPTDGAVVKGNDAKAFSEDSKYLSVDEYRRLEDSVRSRLNPMYQSRYVILVLMQTGMRLGECLGLTWDNLDFVNNTIKIDKSFDYIHTNDFTDGKTVNAKRTIAVSHRLLEAINELPHTNGRIFKDLSESGIRKTFNYCLKEASINRTVRLHSLRHTHASMLLSGGVQLLSVSKRLGHADPSITMRTYAHLLRELEKTDNEKILSIIE